MAKRDVRVDTAPDPTIEADWAIVRITSTGLCGLNLHLYELLAPFMTERWTPVVHARTACRRPTSRSATC